MLYAIVSDIHSNLSALLAVMSHIDGLKADTIVCLGDIVGYAADPGDCIKIIREKATTIVAGNHDAGTTGTTPLEHFNFLAREAILWTRGILKSEEIEFLEGLPYTSESEDCLLVHSSPVAPREWPYIFSREQAWQAFNSCTNEVIFVGHTHRPMVFSAGGDGLRVHQPGEVKLVKGERYLINVGSVGQPRDGDPRASFATYRSDNRTIEFHRIPYDIEKTQDGIIKADLPLDLATRLGIGF
ncbi:MAG: metallophosphoesterase family protein [Candidatus Glassbacteria bacterium]